MRILVATMNEGKLREYERLLADVPGLELETMASLARTGGRRRGPRHVCGERAQEGDRDCAAVGDGLPCGRQRARSRRAWAGGQACHSARYAGEGATDAENNAKLLDELSDTADEERTARFRCAIVIVDRTGRELATAEGACEGRIGHEPKGTHGFGYDPLFIPKGSRRNDGGARPRNQKRNQPPRQGRGKARAPTAAVADPLTIGYPKPPDHSKTKVTGCSTAW